jgi:hypothetical protein
MEMQDKRLPVDVRLLARQAQAANMFAKCLRFREKEFSSKNVPPSIECVDALISVNNQLGLSDRAIGVLQYLKQKYPNIAIQPLWLEKVTLQLLVLNLITNSIKNSAKAVSLGRCTRVIQKDKYFYQ